MINYNTPQLTANCLEALIALKPMLDLDIIVIDNASCDNSVEILKSKFNKDITIKENNNNLGFATANNQGAKIAKGDFLLFLNNDTIIANDFISPCINTLIKNKQLGAVSPTLLLTDKTPQKSAYGMFPTIWRLVTQMTKKDPTLKYHNNYAAVDWISGYAFIIEKTIFEKINGWDANFFLYYEDIEICRKLKACSYKVAVCKDAQIIHLGGQSLKLNSVKTKFFYESQDYYFKKWHGAISSFILKIFRKFYKIYNNIKISATQTNNN